MRIKADKSAMCTINRHLRVSQSCAMSFCWIWRCQDATIPLLTCKGNLL